MKEEDMEPRVKQTKADLSRRAFLKGAASASLGAAGLAAGSALLGCNASAPAADKPAAWLPATWEAQTDVVIIGAGAAGLSAGITMKEEGLGDAIILEAAPEGEEGGNSRVCAQIMFIPDSPQGAVTYQANLNGAYTVEPELLSAWAAELTQNVEWLNGLGAKLGSIPLFAPEYPDVAGSETAKTYCVNGGMPGLANEQAWRFLREYAEDNGVEIRFSSRAKRLIFDPETKEVCGVLTEDGRAFKARKAVILACGGFENNPELMRTYYVVGYPEVGFVGTPYNRGDGILMSQEIGAQLWHMNNFAGPYFGTKTIDKSALPGDLANSNAILYNPAFAAKDFIFLGVDGKRYMNEDTFGQGRHGKVMRGGTYVTQATPFPGWCVFGQKTFDAGDIYGTGGTAWTAVLNKNLAKTNSDAVKNGIFTKCDSVAELAKAMGMDAAVIQKTIDDWNKCCADGYDPQYHRGEDFFDTVGTHGASTTEAGKPAIPAYPIERLEAPFYVFPLNGGILNSQGGPKRNINGEIVDTQGKAIPRLYGSGELGCVYSYMYNGGGNLSEAISSGRFAARNAGKLSGWEA
jgi:hypothetical protein